jgi:hypothetical protein
MAYPNGNAMAERKAILPDHLAKATAGTNFGGAVITGT